MKWPTLQKKIVAFLTALPNIHDSDGQRAFIYHAGLDPELRQQIVVGKSPAQFIQLLLPLLLEYGMLSDQRQAIEAVIEAAKDYVGTDKKALCDSLIQELRSTLADDHQQKRIVPWDQWRFLALSIGLSLLSVALYLVLAESELQYSDRKIIQAFVKWTNILGIIEAKTLDFRFQWRGPKKPGDQIVIIEINEHAEQTLGRWQADGRQWIAKLLNVLSEEQAKVIGLDFTFAVPSNEHDDRQLADALQRSGNVILGMYHEGEPHNTGQFNRNIAQVYSPLINRVRYNKALALAPNDSAEDLPLRILQSAGIEFNLPMFGEAAKSVGYFSMIPDADGYIRRVPLLMNYQGDYYPAFSLEIARVFLDVALPLLHTERVKDYRVLQNIQLRDRFLPVDERGNLLINYYGAAHSFTYYSLLDVITEKRFPRDAFKDKIVLVGQTSAVNHDVYSTPFQPVTFPGVEIHATIIENILQQDFLSRPPWIVVVEAMVLVFLGIVMGVFLPRIHIFKGGLLAFCLFGLILFSNITYFVFVDAQIWLNFTFPSGFLLCNYVMFMVYHQRKRDVPGTSPIKKEIAV